VPGLQELAAADPSVQAALGGRSALTVRRGSEAEEVIRFLVFLFFLGVFFFSVSSGVVGGLGFCRLMCLFGCREKCVNIFV
jgi:nitrate reductase NapE component